MLLALSGLGAEFLWPGGGDWNRPPARVAAGRTAEDLRGDEALCTFDSPRAALDMLADYEARGRLPVVVTDLIMPTLSGKGLFGGLELLEQLPGAGGGPRPVRHRLSRPSRTPPGRGCVPLRVSGPGSTRRRRG